MSGLRVISMTLKGGVEIRVRATYYPPGVDADLTDAADRVVALLSAADDGEVFEKAPEVIQVAEDE